MSKPIRMTDEFRRQCVEEFDRALSNIKVLDGTISFQKKLPDETNKATVYFTAEAWMKMMALIREFSTEVAWHGVVQRGNDESLHEYVVTDIVVYPQTVASATVEMDTGKYDEWLRWLWENNEEAFDNIRMQGHSHVNMAVNPSQTDLTHQAEILQQVDDDNFYIFMIWNKSLAHNVKIYDMKKNILFEDKDVTVKLVGSIDDLDTFLAEAKKMVESKSYSYTPKTTSNPPASTGSYNPLGNAGKKEEKPAEIKDRPKAKIGAGWSGAGDRQTSLYDGYDDYGDYWDRYRGYGR